MHFATRLRATALGVVALSGLALSQTWSACNPLHTSKCTQRGKGEGREGAIKLTSSPIACPANTALAMTVNVDFTKGAVDAFRPSGGTAPTYGRDGVSFTVARGGDAPQLISVFYIMFGRVEVTMKAAPGKGIVSTLVLQSDTLDEIDLEWLGADGSEVQSNYFGKGLTTSYNRGQFHKNPGNQDRFITYAIDWTQDRIIWSIDGTAVRTLKYADAEPGQYPQTPMQVKFGAWSGGDPANPSGTVEWARGPTDYSRGPFSMLVRSIVVADYSSGKQYKYKDTSGTWQSIEAVGGSVNGNKDRAGSITVTATAAAATSLSPSVPAGIGGPAAVKPSAYPSPYPVPEGWRIRSDGKLIPAAGALIRPPHLALIFGPLILCLVVIGIRR
ncbi:hypothetical protein RB601_004826 [Gaeumannomyces tritici]